LSLCGPVMDRQPVQDVPRLSLSLQLLPLSNPELDKARIKLDGWMLSRKSHASGFSPRFEKKSKALITSGSRGRANNAITLVTVSIYHKVVVVR